MFCDLADEKARHSGFEAHSTPCNGEQWARSQRVWGSHTQLSNAHHVVFCAAQIKNTVQQKKKEKTGASEHKTKKKNGICGNKKECVQLHKGPTFMAYDGPRGCLKADNPRHIVIGQDVHCHSVRAGQNSASTFRVHQTNEETLVILRLRVIQNC